MAVDAESRIMRWFDRAGRWLWVSAAGVLMAAMGAALVQSTPAASAPAAPGVAPIAAPAPTSH